MSKNNNNSYTTKTDLVGSGSKYRGAPRLVWFYLLWASLAALSTRFGEAEISIPAALFLIGGICSTNFFFLMVSKSPLNSPPLQRLLATYQAIMGLAWTSAYFYFSSNAGDLVLGMYVTILLFAVFYLTTRTFIKLCAGALLSYLFVFGLQLATAPADAYPLADSIRFVILVALSGWCYSFAQQFHNYGSQLQFRNEELQNVVDRVTKISEEDHLTKSYNRRYIMDILARERALADRAGKTFSILLFDIDHFKRVNDEFGHLVGDQILKDFARRVKIELRGMDTVNPTNSTSSFGRYGGEEFIAVLPETDLLGARRCAERVRELIAGQSFRDTCTITVSAGVAEYKMGETIPLLLTRADQALYQAKRDGRNRVRCSERRVKKSDPTIPKLRILK